MEPFRTQSTSEQLTAYLRQEILCGNLSGTMPGIKKLVQTLGVSSEALTTAVKQLEHDGLLVSQGDRRRRRIVQPEDLPPAPLRVGLLLNEPGDMQLHYIVDLRHQLLNAGHDVNISSKSLTGLGMDVRRISRFVGKTEADVWVVLAGSREVLEWFVEQPVPALAFFGRMRRVPIASVGPDKGPAHIAIARRLVALGHRRIILLTQSLRRCPQPGLLERRFLEELEDQGIEIGPYNLPNWEDNAEDFLRCLDSLFDATPPTALVIDEAPMFHAARDHLARRGILSPEHVSLICTDHDSTFAWCRPSIAHIHWDSAPLVRRVVRWAGNISRGIDDRRQTFSKSTFFEGGTIGPVAGRR